MEFLVSKHRKKRKRRYCYLNSNKCYDQIKLNVTSEKSKNNLQHNKYIQKPNLFDKTMDASAFWENYKAAYEWQKKHNIVWWKTKYFALERENYILKENIRNLIECEHYKNTLVKSYKHKHLNKAKIKKIDDKIEFYLNEDMINFLSQNIQHKMELKNKKYSQSSNEVSSEKMENEHEWVIRRNENAKLLYGKASSKVLAMETALQTTIERHIDKKKPHYWPNIPLRL